jgi:hypothetical protein
MGTKADCKSGNHTADNQGLCWWCGLIVEPDWWAAYIGERQVSDTEIREQLEDLDNSDVSVTSWEARFIDSVVYKQSGPLSESQRRAAGQIIEKYRGRF